MHRKSGARHTKLHSASCGRVLPPAEFNDVILQPLSVYSASFMTITTVRPQKKNKANYFLAQRHQTATKRSNFWQSDLREYCEFAYDYVVHLICVMPIPGKTSKTSCALAINKTVKQ